MTKFHIEEWRQKKEEDDFKSHCGIFKISIAEISRYTFRYTIWRNFALYNLTKFSLHNLTKFRVIQISHRTIWRVSQTWRRRNQFRKRRNQLSVLSFWIWIWSAFHQFSSTFQSKSGTSEIWILVWTIWYSSQYLPRPRYWEILKDYEIFCTQKSLGNYKWSKEITLCQETNIYE